VPLRSLFFWDIALHHWSIGPQSFGTIALSWNTGHHSPCDVAQYPRRRKLNNTNYLSLWIMQ